MIDEQSSASEQDYASDNSAIGAGKFSRPIRFTIGSLSTGQGDKVLVIAYMRSSTW